MNLFGFVTFPLYENDHLPIEPISSERLEAVAAFENDVKSGRYTYIDNPCLCGKCNPNEEIIISNKDRYGIDVVIVLCKNCGIIRTQKRLDDPSLADFYSHYYRKIYGHGEASISDEFGGQVKKGEHYRLLLEKYKVLGDISSVLDYGCGTGGTLVPFSRSGIQAYGCDYAYERLTYGREKGLTLFHAEDDYESLVKNGYDLIVLSHVMEHLSNPIEQLNELVEMVNEEKYLLIIVPSPLNIGNSPYIMPRYFQNVHLYNFYQDYLRRFFAKLNLEVIYGNEVCEFILKKSANWEKATFETFDNESLHDQYKKIERHLQKSYILHNRFSLGYLKFAVKKQLVSILEQLKIKSYIKKIHFKYFR